MLCSLFTEEQNAILVNKCSSLKYVAGVSSITPVALNNMFLTFFEILILIFSNFPDFKKNKKILVAYSAEKYCIAHFYILFAVNIVHM